MSGEIIVNTQELDRAEKRLSALLRKTQNRRIRSTISKSRGAFVKELNDCSQQLNSLSDALQKLFAETYQVVANTREAFSEADQSIAKSLKGDS